MSSGFLVLLGTAASIGFLHVLLGPDHYLPFIVLSSAGKWSLRKTAVVTLLCGLGHVLSSAFIGMAGIALGIAVTQLEEVESFRGSMAAWALIAFGLLYGVWGLRRAWRNQSHSHSHVHEDGIPHTHGHVHTHDHLHVHESQPSGGVAPWVLFTIFVFGPCEPLIPLVIYAAATASILGVVLLTVVFGVTTLLTMLAAVLLSSFGLKLLPVAPLERYSHALAGGILCLCGFAMEFLGM